MTAQMNSRAAELFARVRDTHELAVIVCKELRDRANRTETKSRLPDEVMEDMTNIAYAMDKCDKFLKETDKLCRQLGELHEKIVCALWSAMAELDMTERSVKTEYVTAVPNVRMLATIPREESEPVKYAAMMDDLGVPRHLWQGLDHAVVKPYWPGLIGLFSRLSAEGRPLPRGVDPEKTYPSYTLHFRGKKGPDE